MITKGIIINKVLNSNKYIVRIPFFEQAGINPKNNISNSSYFEASINYNPGTFEAYKVNDVVYVGFEDNSPSKPIILGKLYLGINDESESYQFNKILHVTEEAKLPANTSIGNVNFNNLLNNLQRIENIQDKLTMLETNVKSINTNVLFSGIYKLNKDDFFDKSICSTNDLIKNKLILIQFYFGGISWSKTSFSILFDPSPLENLDSIVTSITGVGEDNKYIKLYGIKIVSNGESWKLIASDGQNQVDEGFNITKIIGFN